jgi:hypothetical protein
MCKRFIKMSDEKARIQIVLDEELKQKVKIKCVEEKTTITKVIIKQLELWVSDKLKNIEKSKDRTSKKTIEINESDEEKGIEKPIKYNVNKIDTIKTIPKLTPAETKLLPYKEQIIKLKNEGKGFREIGEILKLEFNLNTNIAVINRFYNKLK